MRYKLHFLIGLLLAVSCSTSDEQLDKQIQGKWILIGATRNQKATKTLDGAIISFLDNSVTTDITGQVLESSFEIQKKNIVTPGSMPDFKVNRIENDSLVLSANLRSTDFVFIFKKNEG